MKRCLSLIGVNLLLVLPTLCPADELDSLIRDYRQARAATGGRRGGGSGRNAAQKAAPILREIGKLGSDRALAFLLAEMARTPQQLAVECVLAILVSPRKDALPRLFRGFEARPKKVALSILRGIDAHEKPTGSKRRQEGRKPRRLDPRSAERELLRAAHGVRDLELRQGLVPLVGRLDSVAAARAVVALASGRGKPDEDGLHSAAVAALDSLARRREQVREWLEDEAISAARRDPGRLAVVVEVAGRLGITTLRGELEKLLGHATDRVALSALNALSKIEAEIPVGRIQQIAGRLKGRLPILWKASIADSLARAGTPETLKALLEMARRGDVETRAVAVGGLRLARQDPAALEGLLETLEDDAFNVRSIALQALVGLRRKPVIGALIELLAVERVERLKVDALRGLVQLTGHNMGPVAEDWRKWWSYAAKDFEFPGRREEGTTRVKIYDLSYFGIEVASKRIAFLCDVSNSMLGPGRRGGRGGGSTGRKGRPGGRRADPGERKIDVLKKELTRILRKLPSDALINVHVFDGKVRSWSGELRPLDERGRREAIEYVKGLTLDWGTNIFDTIDLAFRDRRVDTLYLLTDGRPTTGKYKDPPGILHGVRELNRARGIVIHTIAFGAESKLLETLAQENGGEYRFVKGSP